MRTSRIRDKAEAQSNLANEVFAPHAAAATDVESREANDHAPLPNVIHAACLRNVVNVGIITVDSHQN